MCIYIYYVVINIPWDAIADVVRKYENASINSDDRALIRVLRVENGWGAPSNNPVDSFTWRELQQVVYRRHRIRDVEHLKEVLQTCWQQIGQDAINGAIEQFCKRLSLVVATSGGHIEHPFD